MHTTYSINKSVWLPILAVIVGLGTCFTASATIIYDNGRNASPYTTIGHDIGGATALDDFTLANGGLATGADIYVFESVGGDLDPANLTWYLGQGGPAGPDVVSTGEVLIYAFGNLMNPQLKLLHSDQGGQSENWFRLRFDFGETLTFDPSPATYFLGIAGSGSSGVRWVESNFGGPVGTLNAYYGHSFPPTALFGPYENLAFRLHYSVPEPTSLTLLLTGAVLFSRRLRHREVY